MKRVCLIVLLFALGVAGQFLLAARRPVKSPVLAESALAALGGFRSLAAEAVWFRADRLQRDGRYVELAQLASTLCFLEPHTPEVWSYAAWNLAYNISVMMPTEADRWRWVKAAIHLLRDEGLKLNPDEVELYRELAWMFQLKIGADLDSAAPLYRREWKAVVEDVIRRDAWRELAMDPVSRDEVARRYGITDWTDAFASAIYWADRGLACATEKTDIAFLNEIVRQSVVSLRKSANMVK